MMIVDEEKEEEEEVVEANGRKLVKEDEGIDVRVVDDDEERRTFGLKEE